MAKVLGAFTVRKVFVSHSARVNAHTSPTGSVVASGGVISATRRRRNYLSRRKKGRERRRRTFSSPTATTSYKKGENLLGKWPELPSSLVSR